MMDADERIDAALDKVLRAAGTRLRNYMPTTQDDLRKAMRELGGTAWEPIATAPKDGTRILLAKIGESDGLPEFDVPPTPWSIRWATMGSWSAKYQKWWDGVEPCGLAGPNYWMRLVPPKPPNGQAQPPKPRSG